MLMRSHFDDNQMKIIQLNVIFVPLHVAGPLSEVQTAVGLEVQLPCDLIPASVTLVQDKVTLVIWYREGNDKPIYT